MRSKLRGSLAWVVALAFLVAACTGSEGPPVPTGDQGPTGQSGTQGIQGQAGTTGAQGVQGQSGPEGPTGPTRSQGIHGPQGLAGEAAVVEVDGHASHVAADAYATTMEPVGHWHVFAGKTVLFTVTDTATGQPATVKNLVVQIYRAGSTRVTERSVDGGQVVYQGDGIYSLEYTPTSYEPYAFAARFEEEGQVFATQAWVVEVAKDGEEGIIPFSYFMVRVFKRIQDHILGQNDELSRRATEMEALLRVGQVVGESLDLDRVLPSALEAVIDGTTAEAAEVWLLDRQEGTVVLLHHRGAARDAFLEITRLALGEGYPGIVAQTGTPILVHDLPQDERFLRQRVKAQRGSRRSTPCPSGGPAA